VGAVYLGCAKVEVSMNGKKRDMEKKRYWLRTIGEAARRGGRFGSFAGSGG
jgi:hypothetical protein